MTKRTVSTGLLLALYSGWLPAPINPLQVQAAEEPGTTVVKNPPAADPLKDPKAAVARTSELLEKMRELPLEECWEPSAELVRMARVQPAALERLKTELRGNGPKIGPQNGQPTLLAARALVRLGELEVALPILRKLLLEATTAELRRASALALGLAPALFEDRATPETLKLCLEREPDALTRIAAARALWRSGGRNEARAALAKILQGTERSGRDEAALALASLGLLQPPAQWTSAPESPERELFPLVYARILELSQEPTERGERANLYYNAMEARAQNTVDLKIAAGDQLLHELLADLRKAYPDPGRLEPSRLYEFAAKGMINSLDPFSQYMNAEDVLATQELLNQQYGGIGAYMGIKDNAFTVLGPMYGSPAYEAGLRAQDIIIEIDGEKTADLIERGGANKAIARLKGPPGTAIRLKYMRRGFAKPIEVTLIRDRILVDSIHAVLLPGKLGYIRLTRFGDHTIEELDAALKNLQKKEGARGLILDLRDNPGGLLHAGVNVADRFLGEGRKIVYSLGREEFSPRKDFVATGSGGDETIPLVVLVNSGSASASEIVSGALQDNQRATLVGERTFGKGSVQQLIPVRATNGTTQLRLTIAKYYLPSGRCIHEKGIDPEVKVRPSEQDDWTIRQILALRARPVNPFEEYLGTHWDKYRDVLMKLAEDDQGRGELYPDFAALCQSLESCRLPVNEIRLELRRTVRRRAQDENRQEYTCDWAADEVLQRGIYELLLKLRIDPVTYGPYQSFSEKIKSSLEALSALPPGAGKPDVKQP